MRASKPRPATAIANVFWRVLAARLDALVAEDALRVVADVEVVVDLHRLGDGRGAARPSRRVVVARLAARRARRPRRPARRPEARRVGAVCARSQSPSASRRRRGQVDRRAEQLEHQLRLCRTRSGRSGPPCPARPCASRPARARATPDLDDADAAHVHRRQVLEVAQRRGVDALLRGRPRGSSSPRARRPSRRRSLSSTRRQLRRGGATGRLRPATRQSADRGSSIGDAPGSKSPSRRERRLDRGRRRLAEAADRRVAHRLADLAEQRELVVARAERPPGGEPREQLLLAHGADAARDALAARLVAEERRDPRSRIAARSAVSSNDHHDARAERRAGRARALERQRHVELVGPDEHARPRRRAGSPGCARPPATPPASVEQLAAASTPNGAS